MAGGSRITISKEGVFITTQMEFKVHAGQHVFESGEKINFNVPYLSEVSSIYSNRLDAFSIFKTQRFEYLALYENGEYKQGIADEYARTERFRSNEKRKMKVLLGGDDWHYYISYFGGSKNDYTLIKFVDFVGKPIANLEFRLINQYGRVIVSSYSNKDGEAKFKCPMDNFPILSIKKMIDSTFKKLIRIENNFVREIVFISPKILKDLELVEETNDVGDYLRNNKENNK